MKTSRRLKKQSLISLLTIPIPFFFFKELATDMPIIYIKPLHLAIYQGMILHLLFLLLTVWGVQTRVRQVCYQKWWSGLAYNLLPVELLLLLAFAQYHFVITIVVLLLVLSLCIFCSVGFEYANSDKYKEHNKVVFELKKRRAYIVLLSVVLLVPSVMGAVKYNMKPPVYVTTGFIDGALMSFEPNKTMEQLLQENKEVCLKLKENTWQNMGIQQKLDTLAEVAKIECAYLGIPTPVELKSTKLELFTLASYSSGDEPQIEIDTQHLQEASVDEVLNSICHEIYHHYEAQVVAAINWENAENISYFETVREWRDNFINYHSGYDGYDAYAEQAIEKDAREYGEKQASVYLNFVTELEIGEGG